MASRRLPSLKALRAFEAAARHGSFSEAARELNVTHAAISHQIRALEEELGAALFHRTGRHVELTERGVSVALSLAPASAQASAIWSKPADSTGSSFAPRSGRP